ncbi:MAG: LysR family transcriptional regulator [Alphaproteobacteria bacterium]|nr:LysR family transcriptional regulator [Alphaproteobacteria bacterium]MBU1515333.1 LysR family transcriptional regulator [Alphaproteobacteria bacterium]MBU2095383.1 LysR family transcriptional regulator [Alphaproteobacteria bacterium]MBU2152597.1 LysR family transcriptional regulator [Alphaproteobacteria bacterium]MBU2309993.1 LysR family transcriptional regulator [Alphaproteobacteria bacterium]
MDRLDELAVFLAVLETGSLAAAARRLRRSPAAVTRTLSALEARVGARLVERTTRRLAVTDAGRRLADEARAVLAGYEAAIAHEAAGPLRGAVRVSAPLVFGRRHVAPVLMAFLDAHPQVSGELVLNDRNLDLLDAGLDVALRIGALADSALVARRAGEVRRVLVAAPSYLARRGTPERPGDLAEHEVIYSSTQSGPLEWRFEGPRGPQTVRLRPRLMINAVEPVVEAAVEGRGVTRVFSYQVADELADGRLVALLEAYEPAPIPVQLVTAGLRLMPPRVRAFVDFAAAALGRLAVVRPA